MRRRNVLSAATASAALASGCGGTAPSNAAPVGTPGAAGAGAAGKKSATIELEKGGTITIDLFPDAAPNWVNNFVQKSMAAFYNGLTFHRVEDWVIQGGDPRGNGTGGGQIATELNER